MNLLYIFLGFILFTIIVKLGRGLYNCRNNLPEGWANEPNTTDEILFILIMTVSMYCLTFSYSWLEDFQYKLSTSHEL